MSNSWLSTNIKKKVIELEPNPSYKSLEKAFDNIFGMMYDFAQTYTCFLKH
jgi:hypothetical protein